MDGRNLNKNLKDLNIMEEGNNPEPNASAYFEQEMELDADEEYDDSPIAFYSEDVESPLTIVQEEDCMAWIEGVLAAEKREFSEISFIFCSDAYILGINKEFLSHDYYTDVITFHYQETDAEPIEGDIYISVERTAENAAIANVTPLHELTRVMAHGVLHLCGYDDATDDLRAAMHDKENFYLNMLNLRD